MSTRPWRLTVAAGLILGGAASAAVPIAAGSPPSPAPPIVSEYVASSGELCRLEWTLVVDDRDPAVLAIARDGLRHLDATLLDGVRGATSIEPELRGVVTAVRAELERRLAGAGHPATVFLAVRPSCTSVPAPDEDGATPLADIPLAERPLSDWGGPPPTRGFFWVASTGEICEVHLLVEPTGSAAEQMATPYLASLDPASVDFSAAMPSFTQVAGSNPTRAELEATALASTLARLTTARLQSTGFGTDGLRITAESHCGS